MIKSYKGLIILVVVAVYGFTLGLLIPGFFDEIILIAAAWFLGMRG